MRLKYMFATDEENFCPSVPCQSNPATTRSKLVTLENFLEETKLEIASAIFRPQIDYIWTNERNAISALEHSSKINLEKADKGTTTALPDTAQKTDEGLQKLTNDKFYKLLSSSIVQDTARKVKELVSKLYRSEHIDLITPRNV